MKYNRHAITALCLVILMGVPWLVTSHPQSRIFIDKIFSYADDGFAAVFLHRPITVTELKNKYNTAVPNNTKVRILIMPGHEPDFGGTEYGDLKEREMTVELAKDLEVFFKNNSHYEVIVARDYNAWNKDLQKYFTENTADITAFFKERKKEMSRLVNNGTIIKASNNIVHNTARTDVAMRLFGINKWVNDNKVDIAIHIHFNDYPRANATVPGKYSGIAIYVPERQFANSTTTRVIADSVFRRLAKYNAVSNLPKENVGVVEEQDLIAIGSYNTLDAPSMLIEYGYIYESQFQNKSTRETTIKDLAFQTYLGVQDFFGSGNDVNLAFDTLMLPYKWTQNITKKNSNTGDVLALQTALLLEGVYPGSGKTKNECPRTGKYGPCTTKAVSEFQKKYGIKGEKEIVGEETKKILNERYSALLR